MRQDQKIKLRLDAFDALCKVFEQKGMERDEASKKAFDTVNGKTVDELLEIKNNPATYVFHEENHIYQILVTPEVMHNWPHHSNDWMCKQLPEFVRKAMFLQHREHSRGLNVREAAEKVCSRFPKYLKFAF